MRFSSYAGLIYSIRLSVQSKIITFGFLSMAIFAAFTSGRAASPGALDLTYGSRGLASTGLPGSLAFFVNAVVVQPDGKSVVTGRTRACSGANCHWDFFIVRFNADGTPDINFGTNGAVITDYFGQDDEANAVALQPDGKIVVVGGALNPTPSTISIQGFKVVRYMPNGTLDTAFGTSGRVYEAFDDAGGIAQSVIVQADGKIIVAGTNQSSMLFVARFNPNGGLDTTFSEDGKYTASLATSQARLLFSRTAKSLSWRAEARLCRFSALTRTEHSTPVSVMAEPLHTLSPLPFDRPLPFKRTARY